MSDATIQILADNSQAKRELKETEGLVGNFGASVTKTLVAIGAVFAAKKIFDFGTQLFSMYAEAEEGQAKLEAVLKSTGNAAGYSAEQLNKQAAALSSITTLEDDVITGAQTIIATFKNIKGDEFRDATIAAANMATVMDTDIKSASMQIAKALNDPLAGMAALTKAGVQFTDSQKDAIAAMVAVGDVAGAQRVILGELESQFGGAAEAVAGTFSGRLKQLKNQFGEIGEELIGAFIPAMEALVPVVQAGVNVLTNVVSMLTEQSATIGEFSSTVISSLMDIGETIFVSTIYGFTILEEAISNFGTVAQYVFVGFQAKTVEAFNVVAYYLTEVIPGLLSWFLDNWQDIFTDIGNFTFAVLKNMLTNVWEVFKAIGRVLAGEGLSFEFTGLTDGFEATLREFPKIADRVVGETEAALKKQASALGTELALNVFDRAEARINGLKGLMDKTTSATSLDSIGADLKAMDYSEVTTRDESAPKAAKTTREKASEANSEKAEDFKAAFVGVEELNRRISEASATTRAEKQADEKRASMIVGLTNVETVTRAVATAQEIGNNVMDNVLRVFTDQKGLTRELLTAIGISNTHLGVVAEKVDTVGALT